MRWLMMLLLSMFLTMAVSGCVYSDEDGTPDSVIVDSDPPASSTTIIENADPPDVDLNVDADVDDPIIVP